MFEMGFSFSLFWVLLAYLKGIGVPMPELIYWQLGIFTSGVCLIKLPAPTFWLILLLGLVGRVTYLYW